MKQADYRQTLINYRLSFEKSRFFRFSHFAGTSSNASEFQQRFSTTECMNKKINEKFKIKPKSKGIQFWLVANLINFSKNKTIFC